MSDCCSTDVQEVSEKSGSGLCPACRGKGKKVKIITLKSMLQPTILSTLNASLTHYFCSTSNCDVVYFDTVKKKYLTSEIKVSVHQKNTSLDVPICYCFNWTKEKLIQYVEEGSSPNPVEHIRENIQQNRCGCEVNNPQGSCCLANVTSYMKSLEK
ncbi:putative iron-sulfur cluster-binding metallochaperone [Alkalihalobacterium bogoriense]|uniref:putative iron-sulfur cluster-binding metallochaperone n=1 Tax=Alkalihalobacterium bogoriense TaxID=246272 RepID=UPI00047E9628|nr:copper chaperone Copz family protein [Alkalihalobacterium bogoriense]